MKSILPIISLLLVLLSTLLMNGIVMAQNESPLSGLSAIFGEKRKQFSAVMTAKYDGKKIQGRVYLKGAKSTATEYPFRLLRQTDIPALSK